MVKSSATTPGSMYKEIVISFLYRLFSNKGGVFLYFCQSGGQVGKIAIFLQLMDQFWEYWWYQL